MSTNSPEAVKLIPNAMTAPITMTRKKSSRWASVSRSLFVKSLLISFHIIPDDLRCLTNMVISAMPSGRSRHGNLALRIKPVELNRCFRIANLSRSMGIVKRSGIATYHRQRKADFFQSAIVRGGGSHQNIPVLKCRDLRSAANSTPDTALRAAKCVITAELRDDARGRRPRLNNVVPSSIGL